MEKQIENRLVTQAKVFNGKAFKWVSPGCTGVPDRIVILPGPKIAFVELKRDGRKNGVSPRQGKMIAWLCKMGCKAVVINSIEQVDMFLQELANE